MRAGAVKVESNGSFWWIDEGAMEYLRLPKVEAPRAEGWAPVGTTLEDGRWISFTSWEVTADRLSIVSDESGGGVIAPRWEVS